MFPCCCMSLSPDTSLNFNAGDILISLIRRKNIPRKMRGIASPSSFFRVVTLEACYLPVHVHHIRVATLQILLLSSRPVFTTISWLCNISDSLVVLGWCQNQLVGWWLKVEWRRLRKLWFKLQKLMVRWSIVKVNKSHMHYIYFTIVNWGHVYAW